MSLFPDCLRSVLCASSLDVSVSRLLAVCVVCVITRCLCFQTACGLCCVRHHSVSLFPDCLRSVLCASSLGVSVSRLIAVCVVCVITRGFSSMYVWGWGGGGGGLEE